jgi:hypothetical protein
MTPDDLTDFFVASAGVAGALIGLLFVAITVSGARFADTDASAPLHRVRARAALTSFMNALTVSLFALIPGQTLAPASIAVACTGLVFVLATLISLARLRVLISRRVHEAVFLVGLAVVFCFQLSDGLRLNHHPRDAERVTSLAILVVVCFLIGVYRAWDLVGGPSFGLGREVTELLRDKQD